MSVDAVPVERRQTPRRDDIIHLVPQAHIESGTLIALCGFDCSGRTEKPWATASCVVCIDLSKSKR